MDWMFGLVAFVQELSSAFETFACVVADTNSSVKRLYHIRKVILSLILARLK